MYTIKTIGVSFSMPAREHLCRTTKIVCACNCIFLGVGNIEKIKYHKFCLTFYLDIDIATVLLLTIGAFRKCLHDDILDK